MGTRYLDCVLVSEGPTDRTFLPELLRRAILDMTVACSGPVVEVAIVPLGVRHSQVREVLGALAGATPFDLILYHHDGYPAKTATAKIEELRTALAAAPRAEPLVPVVPVREVEAWLLADPDAVARVAGVRPATVTRSLPPEPHQVEDLPEPKANLEAALKPVTRGGFLKTTTAERFGRVAENIDLARLGRVPSFQRWWNDMDAALEKLGYQK
jgi:hypothetical protein